MLLSLEIKAQKQTKIALGSIWSCEIGDETEGLWWVLTGTGNLGSQEKGLRLWADEEGQRVCPSRTFAGQWLPFR